MAEEEAIRTGGCQCGAIRYEISSPPVELYVCHCRECQKQSSSAFGISANLMSLGAIDFGMIVDGAVVMMENSARRLSAEGGREETIRLAAH